MEERVVGSDRALANGRRRECESAYVVGDELW